MLKRLSASNLCNLWLIKNAHFHQSHQMTHNFLRIATASLLALGLAIPSAQAQTELANPSFEEDAANVGNPDGWNIHKDAKVKVVGESPSSGKRALRVEGGYAAVEQNLQITPLAGQRVSLSIDAKGESPDAVFGVRIGWYDENGKWRDAALFWNQKLTAEYQTFDATRELPATVRPGRFWLAIYRSDKQSTFLVDNIQLQVSGGLNAKENRRAVALSRDAGYFLKRLEAATTLPDSQKATWKAAAEAIVKEANAAAPSLLESFKVHEKKVGELNTELFTALATGKPILANWAPAFERLEPDSLPPLAQTAAPTVLALRGQHQAFGVDIANGSKAAQKITVTVQGLPANSSLTWRRQVFTETWYTKGQILLADPLVKLTANNTLELAPGEMARLYADVEVAQNTPPGQYSLQLQFKEGTNVVDSRTLPFTVSPRATPPRHMAHFQFLYPTGSVVSNHTKESVRDLETHGVTDIEWPFMPPAVFDDKGNLISADFTNYDRLLESFGPSSIRLNTFWQTAYTRSFKKTDGTLLPLLSPEWKNAFKQIFQKWLDRAQEKGVAPERITIMVADEIHSKALENSPDAGIRQYEEIATFIRSAFPQVKNYLTLSYYGFPKDMEVAVPLVDVIMPHLPQPEKLGRNAPPTYNPQKAFAEEIYPLLNQHRENRGLQLWSYHVAAGRSDDVNNKAPWNRGYGILAASSGHTGIAYWAYNVAQGSTWDDTDGSLLDYNFVYDGTEKNPLALKWNVTKEPVVPSLRWEANRAALQDADIILELERLPATPQTTAALEAARQIAAPGGKMKDGVTTAQLEAISRQLREAYHVAGGM